MASALIIAQAKDIVGKPSLHMADETVTVGLIWIGWKL
jgi:hypothetical protein